MTTTTSPPAAVDRLVDWGVAAATARRLTRPGPEVSPAEAADVVGELREDAAIARGHVAEVTGLDAPAAGA
ncbi:MAG: zinc-dependent metalloprotease, partial [Actinomycetota bacterium]|nr:zinc-dependent metalloprotease [Actinomycetota bacterium]